jgi:hypothetical protein
MAKFDTQKHTLHLRSGDFDFIATTFAARNLSASYVIREIVSRFVDDLKLKLQQMEKESEENDSAGGPT